MESSQAEDDENDVSSLIKIPSMLKKSPVKSAMASPDKKKTRAAKVAFSSQV